MGLKGKAHLKVKHKLPKGRLRTGAGGIESFRVYQAIRHDSGLQVTFLSLSLEGFEFIPAKTIPIFHYCLLPRLLSERSDAWMRPKAPGGWRGHVHSTRGGCQCFASKGSHGQQLWAAHTAASIWWASPRRPTGQLKREHSVRPLKHPVMD